MSDFIKKESDKETSYKGMSDELPRAIKRKLDSFATNLSLLICDRTLKEKQIPTRLYFDTHDIRQCVTGLFNYYSEGKGFSGISGLAREQSLIYGMAIQGHLDQVFLLKPHHKELERLIGRRFDLPLHKPRNLAEDFLKAAKEWQAKKTQNKTNISPITGHDQDLLADYQDTPFWYRVTTCLEGAWHDRMSQWLNRQQKPLSLDETSEELTRPVIELIQSKTYGALADEFAQRRRRPDQTRNNETDLRAMAILQAMLDQVKHTIAQSEEVDERSTHCVMPLFFDPSYTFQRIVEAAGLSASFYIEEDGHKCSIFRDASYLIFRTTFLPGEEFSVEELKELRTRVNFIRSFSDTLEVEKAFYQQLDGIPSERTLAQLVEDAETNGFVETVWLPYWSELKERNEEEDLAKVWTKLLEQLPADKDEASLREEIEKVHKDLLKKINNLDLIDTINQLTEELQIDINKLKERLPSIDTKRAISEFGLLQFGISPELQIPIARTLNNLWRGTEDALSARVALAYSYHHLTKKTSKLRPDDDALTQIAAVLWALRKLSWLDTLCLNYVKHLDLPIPIQAIFARATLEQTEERSSSTLYSRTIIANLEACLARSQDIQEKIRLNISLSYLYYALWRFQGFRPAWETPLRFTLPAVAQRGRELILKADQFAATAFTLCVNVRQKAAEERQENVLPEPIEAYALNCRLYALVQGLDDPESFQEMGEVAAQLSQYVVFDDAEIAIWNHRYDDTLARYYHRLSLSAKTLDDWKQWIGDAEFHLEAALKKSHDAEIEAHRRTLSSQKAKGFRLPKFEPININDQ